MQRKQKINVITLFPNLFDEHLKNLPFKKALEKDLIEVNLINLRDFALDKYGSVDAKSYGGGVGMVLMVEPIYKALQSIGVEKTQPSTKEISTKKIVLLSPKGKKFAQKMAVEYKDLTEVTFICGRYEGIDARVEEHLVDDVISIGDYVLSGGELAALVIMETMIRLIPGVLEKETAAQIESFSDEMKGTLEYPQYTRPEDFKGMIVPKVLLSGNHEEIEKWRKQNSKKTSN